MNRQAHILIVCTYRTSALTTCLIPALTAAGYIVRALDLSEDTVKPPLHGWPFFLRPALRVRAMRRGADALPELAGADILIGSDLTWSLPFVLSRQIRPPVIALSHGSDAMIMPGLAGRIRRQVRRSLAASCGTMVTSTFHARYVRELDPSGREPFVLGGWLTPEWFQRPVAADNRPVAAPNRGAPVIESAVLAGEERIRETARMELGLPPRRTMIFAPRGTAAVYRPGVVLEAAAIARKRGLDFLLVMRLAESADEWEERARKLGLEGAFKPYRDRIPREQMPRWYDAATVVLQGLERESFGYTGVEAMARGRVLVQPASVLTGEMYPPEQRALLAENTTPEALADALERALRDQAARERIEAANRAWAQAHYSEAERLPETAERLRIWLAGIVAR